jgi:hypothetical protein
MILRSSICVPALALAVVALGASCSHDHTAGAARDAGMDARVGSGGNHSSVDAKVDSGNGQAKTNTGTSSGTDAGTSSGTDAGTSSGSDAGGSDEL